jgi:hypothetical protein
MIINFAQKLGYRIFKDVIDMFHRKKVVPIEGSVLYTDLYFFVEHSGIYVGSGKISNIKVNNLFKGDSSVKISDAKDFTEKAFRKKIYVSSNERRAVGNIAVSDYALSRVGDKRSYNLFLKNCHTFCTLCLDKINLNTMEETVVDTVDETWERTIRALKRKAQKKLGATKWYVWDLDATYGEGANEEYYGNDMKKDITEQDMQQIIEEYENIALTPENIQNFKMEQSEITEYVEEISDEDIPEKLMNRLKKVQASVVKINDDVNGKYKEFLKEFSTVVYSYSNLKKLPENSNQIIKEMVLNNNIKAVVEKLGKGNAEEEKNSKKEIIIEMSQNEVFGIHKSNDITRLLPSELVLFENEELENLFYAKMYENSLLTYEIAGEDKKEKDKEEIEYKKGPVIACIDTSGSMRGNPIKKARALLLAISKILKTEKRKMYVILFGSAGQILEFKMENEKEIADLLKFLNQEFNGGTDFNTPLKRAVKIIENEKNYEKSDILFVTDGLCSLNEENRRIVESKKKKLNFKIFTVNCTGYTRNLKDGFSDEIIGI